MMRLQKFFAILPFSFRLIVKKLYFHRVNLLQINALQNFFRIHISRHIHCRFKMLQPTHTSLKSCSNELTWPNFCKLTMKRAFLWCEFGRKTTVGLGGFSIDELLTLLDLALGRSGDCLVHHFSHSSGRVLTK